jgi:tetratricopeptide (TPR) repeat protein
MPSLVRSVIRVVRATVIAASIITASAHASTDDLLACQSDDTLPENKLKSCAAVIADRTQIPEIRAEAYLNRGLAHEDLDKLGDAIEDFSQAIMLNPEYRALYHYRGMAYERDGKADLAIADFSEAIKLDPTDTEALVLRGQAQARIGALDKAMDDYQTALALDPNDPDALTARGEAYETQGERDKAIADFRKALEFDPQHDEAREALKRLGASL